MRDFILAVIVFLIFTVRCTPVQAADFTAGVSAYSTSLPTKYRYNDDSALRYIGVRFNAFDAVEAFTFKTIYGDRATGLQYAATLPYNNFFIKAKIGVVHGYNDEYVVCVKSGRAAERPRKTPTGCYYSYPAFTRGGYTLNASAALGYQIADPFNVQIAYTHKTVQLIIEVNL